MNKFKFSIKKITLILLFALSCTKLVALDKIEFTWQVGYAFWVYVYLNVTDGGSFTVNWGDGTIETNSYGHFYNSSGEYTVTFTSTSAACRFTAINLTDCFPLSKLIFYNCTEMKRVDCSYNNLTELNISACSNLIWLNCSENNLTELNLSACSKLTGLFCDKNQLQDLNLSGCNALIELSCSFNRLTSIDLSDTQNLEYLSCWNNPLLSTLELSKCTKLTMLNCSWNGLTTLGLSNCSALTTLICSNNQLTYLDLSNCDSLIWLVCANNNISSINFNGCSFLEAIACSENQLSSLDLFSCVALRHLSCENNRLVSIIFNNSSPLWALYCYSNQLQLSDLFKAHLLIKDEWNKLLGTQTLLATWVNLETELFAEHSVFDGIFTKYVVTRGGSPAPAGDFTVKDGKITFHTRGTYVVTMTNDAIVSDPDYPAVVKITLNVETVGVAETWRTQSLRVYPNPTHGLLQVTGDELQVTSVEVFDIYGKKCQIPLVTRHSSPVTVDISHLPAGVYFLSINERTTKIIKL